MVTTTDSGIVSPGEVESTLQTNQQDLENQTLQSLGRQLSIYSLTLDEFQHTLCEGGKNFGSMNMDEFLNSIWSAEENQAQSHPRVPNATAAGTNDCVSQSNNASKDKGIEKQHSLTRQVSLSIPEPLCGKTVEEVWSEIHNVGNKKTPNAGTTQRQVTFGEMTLEDFLVRAGVVREQNHAPATPQQLTFGLQQNSIHPPMGPNFGARPAMAVGGGGTAPTFPAVPQGGVGEVAGCTGGMKRGGGFLQQPAAIGYGARIGNGNGGGFGQVLGSPVSPVSSDGLSLNPIDGGKQYGLDIGGARGGRKRIIDGPVEKVVERRQRRMIKNRESAARSRARKQAYTVELEAELNQLKEENAHLHQILAGLERQRKRKCYEEARSKSEMQSKAQKANEKLRAMRRSLSCHY